MSYVHTVFVAVQTREGMAGEMKKDDRVLGLWLATRDSTGLWHWRMHSHTCGYRSEGQASGRQKVLDALLDELDNLKP